MLRFAGLSAALCLFACDPTKVAEQCVAADLIGQCPAGSNPVLGAQASSDCGGSFEGQTVGDGMTVSGQCGANGSCEFLCQFEVPCTCGVATLSKEQIVCAECPEQSCGDGRCEGTERASCEPGAAGCFACFEDCGGETCGDGDCTGSENPQLCPQDCEGVCTPNARICIGNKVSVCAADGQTSAEVDCAIGAQLCAEGACVAANVCGNGLCEAGEDGVCLADCARVCDPSSRTCIADVLVVCAVDGESMVETNCATNDQICHDGQCRPPDVCGNGLCEAGEEDCAQDCAAICGNDKCENNEESTCPEDCVVCGDDACGAGEQQSCPQDCGICVPSHKECLGLTLRVCNANGTEYDDVDCGGLQLACAIGNCVERDVCGNGLCETGEDEVNCDNDCGETCGDGRCGGLESFETCAVDCDPVCGDGRCEGDENHDACPTDCLESCADGACDGLEDRDNCPGDCGFCGDHECDDGAESASLTPPVGQESCVVDCVITGCQDDGDCNDRVACTGNRCVNGSCLYTADDDLCSGDERCIRFHGCCADDDGDGYADMACGGSDCNDDDPEVHPGALEVCGGGDKNCNGGHKPALAPAKKLTNTPSNKRELQALVVGDELVLAWSGKAAIHEQLELLPVSWGLVPDGAVRVVTAAKVNSNWPKVQLAWHPVKQALGAMWALHQDNGSVYGNKAGWIGLDGKVIGELGEYPVYTCVINSVGYPHTAVPFGALVNGDGVLFSTNAMYSTFPYYQGGWMQLAPTGNLSIAYDAACGNTVNSRTADQLVRIGDFVSGTVIGGGATALVTLDVSLPGSSQVAYPLDHPSAGSRCALGEDGELLTAVCGENAIWYHRVTPNGSAFYSAEVIVGVHTPVGVGKSDTASSGGDAQVGVVTRDAGNNLWFFVRAHDGEPVLEPSIVAGGATVGDVEVLHDGNDFVLVWLSVIGGFEQAFAQRITCE